MRVAVVAETFLPAVNGVVNSVLRLVDHLAVRGHDPVVVAPSGSSYESRCGARVEVVTVPAMRLPRYRQLALARPAGDLTAVLRRLRPDVVHLASPVVLGLTAARAARALGVRRSPSSRPTWPPTPSGTGCPVARPPRGGACAPCTGRRT